MSSYRSPDEVSKCDKVSGQVIQIEAPHFYGEVMTDRDDCIVKATSALEWTIGKHITQIISWATRKSYRISDGIDKLARENGL